MRGLLIWIRRVLMHMRVFVCLAVAECSWHILYRVCWLCLQSISRCPWSRAGTHGYLERFMLCVGSVVELVGRRCVPLGRVSVWIHEGVVWAVVVLLIRMCKAPCSSPLSQLHSSLRSYTPSTMRDICERARATAQDRAEWGRAMECRLLQLTHHIHRTPLPTYSCLAFSRSTPALHLFWRPPTYHTDCTPC
jgi:hypothetical protein